jgi:hypothetical protein
MPNLPAYYLPRPTAKWGAATIDALESLYRVAVEAGDGEEIEYNLNAPKWQFLCYVCDRKNIVAHGSGRADITLFEPRKADDVNSFGDRCAVYAATDGIWPIFFAVMDRDRYVKSLVNSCFRVVEAGGPSEPYYFFSINGDALPHSPWRVGMVYLLPGDGFELQPLLTSRGLKVEVAQCACLEPVKPLAKLRVTPEDFPFLGHIRPHDMASLRARAMADPDGFPWLEE